MNSSQRAAADGGRGYFRPAGVVSYDQAVALIRTAVEQACRDGVHDLLVDATGLTGFPSPDLFQRYQAASAWAAAACGRLRLAVVVPAEMIDPGKFGSTVSANRGLTSSVFATEAEAAAWLDSLGQPPASTAAKRSISSSVV